MGTLLAALAFAVEESTATAEVDYGPVSSSQTLVVY